MYKGTGVGVPGALVLEPEKIDKIFSAIMKNIYDIAGTDRK